MEYVEMLYAVENDTTNLSENSELKQFASQRDRLSVVTDILYFTHSGDETMWKQTKN